MDVFSKKEYFATDFESGLWDSGGVRILCLRRLDIDDLGTK